MKWNIVKYSVCHFPPQGSSKLSMKWNNNLYNDQVNFMTIFCREFGQEGEQVIMRETNTSTFSKTVPKCRNLVTHSLTHFEAAGPYHYPYILRSSQVSSWAKHDPVHIFPFRPKWDHDGWGNYDDEMTPLLICVKITLWFWMDGYGLFLQIPF